MIATVDRVINQVDSSKIGCLREDYDIEAGYYLHREKLGEGGFSKVRLGTHLLTGQKVAIKCMVKSNLGADLFRTVTEISALKTLDHQHIAKLLQVIETDQMIYLVLEHCSGGELFDYIIAKSRLTERESQKIMGSLIHCLAYIHSMGFAHRDLKPENILFDKNHQIKLIDFGLAAKPSREKQQTLMSLETCCGSPAYAAPELISGHVYSGPAVDVWSAGIILYALLVGQLPFDDENMTKLYKKIQSGKFMMPAYLSPDAKSVLTAMIQTDPRKRITIVQLLEHPWIKPFLPNLSIEVQKNNIDDEVLWQVHKYFPTTTYTELRSNIVKGFGYQTATYWLLKAQKLNGISTPAIKYPLILSNSQNTPKPSTPVRGRDVRDSKAINNQGENPERRHVIAAIKRRTQVSPSYKSPKVSTFKPAKVTPRSSPIPVPVKTALRNNNLINSPKTPTKKVPTCDATSVDQLKSPLSPQSINRKRKLFADPPSGVENKSDSDKTPQKIDANLKENFVTPAKRPAPQPTPKKSLLKKILESATPNKKHPRNITINAPCNTGNITMTNFTSPEFCITELVSGLQEKGIECKRKGYTLNCVLNGAFNKKLSFNLEICQFEDRVAIQRKRLKGDAWHYKRICEEILRLSNQISIY